MKASKRDTRESILEAGSAAIVAKSYNGCGLNEILKAAGVPKGSFYHYFRSKEDFGVALAERSGDEHLQVMRRLLGDRSRSPVERIRGYFAWGRDHYAEQDRRQRECLIAKLALEVGQLSEPMRIAIRYVYESWAALLAKTIREAQERGEISRETDPNDLANVLNDLWEGATIRMQIDGNIDALDQAIAIMNDRLLC